MKSRFAWAAVLSVIAAVYWIALFVATHIPREMRLPRGGDKVMHFAAFTLLGLLVTGSVHCWRRPSWRKAAAIIVGLALYGAIDEYLQPLTGRTADIKDWLMDVSGATLGTIAAMVLAKVHAGSASKDV